MTDIRFYHLKTQTLEEALPALLIKAYGKGDKRILIKMKDAASVEKMNGHLWAFHPAMFLPHGSVKDGNPAAHPIWLSDSDDAPNGATIALCAQGTALADVSAFSLICEIFDDFDEAAVQGARARWKHYKEAGHTITYYQQTPDGGWEKKA